MADQILYHALWQELHLRALSRDPQHDEIIWLASWIACLPCGSCRQSFFAITSKIPPDISSTDAYFAWTVAAHNAVSAALGKSQLSVDEAKSHWMNFKTENPMIEPTTKTELPTGPERVGWTLLGGETIQQVGTTARIVNNLSLSLRRLQANDDGSLAREIRRVEQIQLGSVPALKADATEKQKGDRDAAIKLREAIQSAIQEFVIATGK